MKRVAALIISSILLVACGNKNDPNEKNFGAALSQYFDKKGELCLNLRKMPTDISQMDLQLMKTLPTGIASQMLALEAVGLATSVETEAAATDFFGKPGGRKFKVKRYTVSDAGQKFYREKEETAFTLGGSKKVMKGDICFGKKTLDKVVKWEGPMKFGDYQEAGVKYTYKIDNLANWAKRSDIQIAFPHVKRTIDGVATEVEEHAIKLTSLGWEAKGLD